MTHINSAKIRNYDILKNLQKGTWVSVSSEMNNNATLTVKIYLDV